MRTKKVAVITGASRGIGKAIALKLDKEGFIAILVSRSQKNLKDAIKDFSNNAVIIKADVSKEKEVAAMFKKIIKKFGYINILINNVGSIASIGKEINQLTNRDLNQIIKNNFVSAFYCMRESIKYMKNQSRGGQIVNISSIAARQGFQLPLRSVYCATKSALAILSESIQLEMIRSKNRIKIATIYPGLVSTDAIMKKGKYFLKKTQIETIQRFALKPEDVAHAVLMIINQGENSNITELVIRPLFNFRTGGINKGKSIR